MVAAERALARARAGDGEAFRQLTDPLRSELQVHCYRMLGSLQDAEDVLQETLLAAWRSLERFEGRASLRAWLYRIATNRCLNALRESGRRQRHVLPPPPFQPPEPTSWEEPVRLEPYPDALLGELADLSAGPEARYEAREAIQLAFVAALQRLPARQRAALVLRDVLGFRVSEVARMLDTGEGSVKGALQRARATLDRRIPAVEGRRLTQTPSERESALAERFADAFERDDVEGVVSLLTADAWLEMPPYPHAYQGPAAIAAFLRASAAWRGTRRYRLLPTGANRQPAFACYLEEDGGRPATPAGLIVLGVGGEGVHRLTRFMDDAPLSHFFRRSGLPPALTWPSGSELRSGRPEGRPARLSSDAGRD